MKAHEPLVIAWRGGRLRVLHDDSLSLALLAPHGAPIRGAVEVATDVEGLRLALTTALGDRYRMRVADDGSVVGLWRRLSGAG